MNAKEIREFLKQNDYEEVRKGIAQYLLKDCDDLYLAGKIIERGYDPSVGKMYLEEYFYDEGDENSGRVELSVLLRELEEIYNLTDYDNVGEVKFTSVVRLATEEEKEEEGARCELWYVEEDSIDLNDILIHFNTN
jgi:hypothetical protein